MIAVSNTIPSKLHFSSTSLELISLELYISPKILLICLYIPPGSIDLYLQEVVDFINSLSTDCDIIITGDLNMPDTNWSSFSASSSSSLCLVDQICAKKFFQLITQPTHRCGNILDLVLSNSPSRISNVSVENICASQSDHHLISYCIHSSSKNRHSRKSPTNPFCALNYSKANLTELNSYTSLYHTLPWLDLTLPHSTTLYPG